MSERTPLELQLAAFNLPRIKVGLESLASDGLLGRNNKNVIDLLLQRGPITDEQLAAIKQILKAKSEQTP